MERIVLAHSGGLDTSVAIPWLARHFSAEIITVTMDLGQRGELVEIRERALALGALRAHVIDVREEFVRDYIRRALQADAVDDDRSPMATALGRPLIVRKLIDVARMEGATAIAHGCVIGTVDHARVESLMRALDPSLKVIAPALIWNMTLAEELGYARALDIAIPASADGGYKIDSNLWGRSIESARLDDVWVDPPPDTYALTRSPEDCPDQPAFVDIRFDAGVPTRANGIEMLPLEMLESLDTIGGTHGVGRIVAGSSRPGRTIWEAPAAVVLHTAHRELQQRVIERDLESRARGVAREYGDLVNDGGWFSDTRATLDAFVQAIQPRVTGAVRLQLFKGDCSVVAIEPAPAHGGVSADTKSNR